MGIDFKEVALGILARNAAVANSPMGQEFIRILKSGDQAAGEQMAKNICASYGVSQEQAVSQARGFFKI